MNLPEPVKRNPNAAVVIGAATPPALAVTWFVTNVLHHPLSAEDGAALGTLLGGALLWLSGTFKWIGRSVVANGGILGCCRLVFKGRPPS